MLRLVAVGLNLLAAALIVTLAVVTDDRLTRILMIGAAGAQVLAAAVVWLRLTGDRR